MEALAAGIGNPASEGSLIIQPPAGPPAAPAEGYWTYNRWIPYGRLARLYDVVYSAKDYRREARALDAHVRSAGGVTGHRWLDVACGTGPHLEQLRGRWEVTGADASAAMLHLARGRLPRVTLRRGDMRRLALGGRFDGVSCLFSAIAHLRTEAEIGQALRGFRDHLAPGGVVLVETFVDPERFVGGTVGLLVGGDASVRVARAYRSTRRGRYGLVDTEYLIAEQGRPLPRYHERDRHLLPSAADWRRLLAAAGLRGRLVRSPTYRGRWLVVARRAGGR